MGFRTVVVLNNDLTGQWENDPELGKKIFLAGSMHAFGGADGKERARRELPYGQIIEQVHADTQTVAVLDGYGGRPLAQSFWRRGETDVARDIRLLKELANQLGYNISKKPIK